MKNGQSIKATSLTRDYGLRDHGRQDHGRQDHGTTEHGARTTSEAQGRGLGVVIEGGSRRLAGGGLRTIFLQMRPGKCAP
jgi:hypothetical protein